MKNTFFTSEAVSAGHPDKVADQISDAILDQFLAADSAAKVACETLCTTGLVVVAGEIKSSATVDIQATVRKTIADIGYTDASIGFEASSCGVINALHEQSADIRQGVELGVSMVSEKFLRQGLSDFEQGSLPSVNDRSAKSDITPHKGSYDTIGAGDQGIMFGYAVNETAEFMPATLALSNLLLQELDAIRREGKMMRYLRPDAKSQVTIEYGEDGLPLRVDTIVVSTQHAEGIESAEILEDIVRYLLPRIAERDAMLGALLQDDYRLLVNPTGRFVIGGPHGDTGLTGRKIIVDTYGGRACHGGGAFSGKDPSKVDRSAAYMARYIAKNLVAAGIAHEAQVQLAYAIGVAKPVSINVNTFGTCKVVLTDAEIASRVRELFDLRPAAIIARFGLRTPLYLHTAAYGHFGRGPYTKNNIEFFAWEKLDAVDLIKRQLILPD